MLHGRIYSDGENVSSRIVRHFDILVVSLAAPLYHDDWVNNRKGPGNKKEKILIQLSPIPLAMGALYKCFLFEIIGGAFPLSLYRDLNHR